MSAGNRIEHFGPAGTSGATWQRPLMEARRVVRTIIPCPGARAWERREPARARRLSCSQQQFGPATRHAIRPRRRGGARRTAHSDNVACMMCASVDAWIRAHRTPAGSGSRTGGRSGRRRLRGRAISCAPTRGLRRTTSDGHPPSPPDITVRPRGHATAGCQRALHAGRLSPERSSEAATCARPTSAVSRQPSAVSRPSRGRRG